VGCDVNYRIETSGINKVAVVINPLVDKDVEEIRECMINSIEIVDGKGWKGGSINFLCGMDFVEHLSVRTMLAPAQDIDAIEQLTNLKTLEFETCCKSRVNFQNLPNLVQCSLKWRKGCESLFEKTNLRSLVIIGYRNPRLPIESLIGLQKLQVLDSSIDSIDFLQGMSELRQLRLAELRRLIHTDAISAPSRLQFLEIDSCRGFRKIDQISLLTSLTYLCLLNLGEVESLAPLLNLTKLEAFFFYENTNILDGDVASLRKLERLQYLSFANRRHYNCKREDYLQYFNKYNGKTIQFLD
jgi:hypothetical protein